MKMIGKIGSFALCFVLLFGVITAGGSSFAELLETVSIKASAAYSVGDIIEFGSYPQTLVNSITSSVLNDELSNPLNSYTWNSYNYYVGTGSNTGNVNSDGSMAPSDFMRYVDIVYLGQKYRGVQFDDYRPISTLRMSAYYYNNQRPNGYDTGNVYWFKYEPIRWRILDPSKGLVMCETIIDSQPFNNYAINLLYKDDNGNNIIWGDPEKTHYANDYKNSDIRQWLIWDFYNTSFSETEKDKMLLTDLNNSGYFTLIEAEKAETYDSERTEDKVFLLSYSEMINSNYGFSTNNLDMDSARKAVSSDYAKCQGLGYDDWYLRTAGCFSDQACFVSRDGEVSNGGAGASSTSFGIRPAIRLQNLKSDFSAEAKEVWSGDLFTQSSRSYNNKLAFVSAQLSKAAEEGKDAMHSAFHDLGFEDSLAGNYDKNAGAYGIGHDYLDINGVRSPILAIVGRGTDKHSLPEFTGDFFKGGKISTLGHDVWKNVYDFYEGIWAGVEAYLAKHPEIKTNNLRILVTGHSLGGAAANLVAARYTYYAADKSGSSWWGNLGVTQSRIYGYTFGAIKVLASETYVNDGYENIHNVYNINDYFGPCGDFTKYGTSILFAVSAVNSKFGHSDIFKTNYTNGDSHDIEKAYINAIRNNEIHCGKETYYELRNYCPIDLEIYENGKLVGRIKNNQVDESVSTVPLRVEGDTKIAILDSRNEYEIKTIGTDTGTLRVELEDLKDGNIKTFDSIKLEAGKTIIGSTKEISGVDDYKLFTADSLGNKTAEIQTDGTEKPLEVKLSFWQRIIRWFRNLFSKIFGR